MLDYERWRAAADWGEVGAIRARIRLAFAVGLIGPILALLVGLVYLTVQIVSGARAAMNRREEGQPTPNFRGRLRSAPVRYGLEGRCSIHLSYGRVTSRSPSVAAWCCQADTSVSLTGGDEARSYRH